MKFLFLAVICAAVHAMRSSFFGASPEKKAQLNEAPLLPRFLRRCSKRKAVLITCPRAGNNKDAWNQLHSTMKRFLEHNEFSTKSLRNEEANAPNVQKLLWDTLRYEARSGDTIIVYFNMHGGKECGLVCHRRHEQKEYISPKLLQTMISFVPDGVKVLVINSACHSGEMLGLPYFLKKKINFTDLAPYTKRDFQWHKAPTVPLVPLYKKNTILMLASCQADEIAYLYHPNGKVHKKNFDVQVTKALLGGWTLQEFYTQTHDNVYDHSNDQRCCDSPNELWNSFQHKGKAKNKGDCTNCGKRYRHSSKFHPTMSCNEPLHVDRTINEVLGVNFEPVLSPAQFHFLERFERLKNIPGFHREINHWRFRQSRYKRTYAVGDRVSINNEDDGKWYPGTIMKRYAGMYDVEWDDGTNGPQELCDVEDYELRPIDMSPPAPQLRQQSVTNAVQFLTKAVNAATTKKVQFLRTKGITDYEIAAAIKRVNPSDPNIERLESGTYDSGK